MTSPPEHVNSDVVAEIAAVLRERLREAPPDSYSVTLLRDPEQAQRKVMEEAFELCLEVDRTGREGFEAGRVAAEAADVVFHVLAACASVGVEWEAVRAELVARRTGGP